MFTGIIETIGDCVNAEKTGGDLRLWIAAPAFADKGIAIGDSVACNGACLTVVAIKTDQYAFDVSLESLQHSLIGDWQPGSRVNLELAMLPSTRFGGHLVTGHLDGMASLVELNIDARSKRMTFEIKESLALYLAKKGSVTLNGVSLTVNAVMDNRFTINVIPHTLAVTTLGELKKGDQVHIEVDILARYVQRLLQAGNADADSSSLSYASLKEHGFA